MQVLNPRTNFPCFDALHKYFGCHEGRGTTNSGELKEYCTGWVPLRRTWRDGRALSLKRLACKILGGTAWNAVSKKTTVTGQFPIGFIPRNASGLGFEADGPVGPEDLPPEEHQHSDFTNVCHWWFLSLFPLRQFLCFFYTFSTAIAF